MSIACGRPQGGAEGPAHVDACGGGKKPDFLDIMNGWPIYRYTRLQRNSFEGLPRVWGFKVLL